MKRILNHTLTLLLLLICNAAGAQNLPDGWEVCCVNNLTAKYVNNSGSNDVTISFNAPTQIRKYNMDIMDYDYQALSASITKIVVERSSNEFNSTTVIHTFKAPAKGEKLTITDANVSYGTYLYRVVVYVGSSTSFTWDWDKAIRQVIVGQVPANFTDNDVSTSVSGNSVTINFTAPSLSTLGEPMTMPMTCTVAEMTSSEPPTFVTKQTFENAIPGKKYSVTIDNVASGAHTFTLQASTASGANNGIYRYGIYAFVGPDVPGEVRNARAANSAEGVHITWSAPLRGLNGGDMGSLSAITYKVTRKSSTLDGGGVVVANGIKTLECTDVIDKSKEASYVYEIVASNANGSSNGTFTNTVLVGEPNPLPFSETFETIDTYGNVSFDNSWLKEYTGYYSGWFTSGGPFYVNDDNTSVMPHGGDGMGYAMYNYNPWGSTYKSDAIISGHIDVENAECPVLSFWIYDTAADSNLTLNVSVSLDEGDFTNILSQKLGNAEGDGWLEKVIPLLSKEQTANTLQVRIETVADGNKVHAVLFDDITIFDDPTVTAIQHHEVSDASANTGILYNLSGQRISAANAKGIVISNGKKIILK